MNGYEPSTPRTAFGLVAVAMTAITMGALVVLPAKLESVGAAPYMLAAANAATKTPIEVAISPARIDVSEVVNREDDVHASGTTLAAQGIRVKRHNLNSRSRTYTSPARSSLQISGAHD